jgi:hypothetical protein
MAGEGECNTEASIPVWGTRGRLIVDTLMAGETFTTEQMQAFGL